MRFRLVLIVCAVCALLLLLPPLYKAHCGDYVEYKVQISIDGSAAWTITQVSGINASIDTWEGFQQKVATLVDAAMNETQREMTIDVDSLQIRDDISWETQSRKTVYAFTWQDFSITENGKITFGDVFRVADFFDQLYGDGALQVAYPSTYSVQSVSPSPDERDDSVQTLKWLATEYFINSKPNITLTSKSQSESSDNWQQNSIIGLVAAVTVAASLGCFYAIRHHRRKAKKVSATATLTGAPSIESDEEKIVKVIRSSGGTVFQSIIAEQCRFSKAKTSQLLTGLEQKGVVRRYKKGRDKIVTLNEPE